MKLSAIIPTRNRPEDLVCVVESILNQTKRPKELIIVDQSVDDTSKRNIELLFENRQSSILLIYIHDSSFAGLVAAKQRGTMKSSGDVVCFLEDDIVLEPDYFEQIALGFAQSDAMLGCCGIVTNPPPRPLGYNLVFKIFHRGIFKDPRVGLYGSFSGNGHKLILSDVLSGGLSAWCRKVFTAVPFDVANGFFMLEDMEFSTRVVRHFGHCLYINPNARLAHYCSPVNRQTLGPRQRRKIIEYIAYYKKRREWTGAHLALPWLLLGLFAEAMFQSLSAKSIKPLFGYFQGLCEGVPKKLV